MVFIGCASGTLVPDVEPEKITINYVFIGCTQGTMVSDIDFGKMTRY